MSGKKARTPYTYRGELENGEQIVLHLCGNVVPMCMGKAVSPDAECACPSWTEKTLPADVVIETTRVTGPMNKAGGVPSTTFRKRFDGDWVKVPAGRMSPVESAELDAEILESETRLLASIRESENRQLESERESKLGDAWKELVEPMKPKCKLCDGKGFFARNKSGHYRLSDNPADSITGRRFTKRTEMI